MRPTAMILALTLAAGGVGCVSDGGAADGGAGGRADSGTGGSCTDTLFHYEATECVTDADCHGLVCSEINGPALPSRCWSVGCSTDADCDNAYGGTCPGGTGFYCIPSGGGYPSRCAARPTAPACVDQSACPAGQVCCWNGDKGPACAASCAKSALAECTQPIDCGDGLACCVTTAVSGGSQPGCGVTSGSSMCQSSCATSIPSSCSGTQTLHLCRTNADCTGDPDGAIYCCQLTVGKWAIVNTCMTDAMVMELKPTC